MNVEHATYYKIIDNLRQAQFDGDKKKIRFWRNRLEKWQLAYGAYAPIR